MRILRAAGYRRMAWKNGGGETAEIAVYPDRAGIDDFGWRVSMALVAADGPFSVFPGVERTLSVLEGNGIALHIAGQEPVTLDVHAPPFRFAADLAVKAWLVDGPISDLNVMTRTGRWIHRVARRSVEGSVEAGGEGISIVVSACPRLQVSQGSESALLGLYDAAKTSADRPGLLVEGSGAFLEISLFTVAEAERLADESSATKKP